MPQEPFLTSAGWSLNDLVTRGHRFHQVPRVSVSDQNLEATIRNHEASGVPLVIEGMHEQDAWPAAMFDVQWLHGNSNKQIQIRNVHNRQDLDVSFAEYLEHVKSIQHYASVDEPSRWYAKDLECPPEWKKWLDTTTLIPRLLCPHGPADIMQNLPDRDRVETLMCYLGIGDTFTPCHKDLCASFGHNLMCYTENGGSAFWFMTESSAAPSMAKYFQSLGQELDLESHTMSIEEFSAAPCEIYITEQKVGDLMLVPPRSCHQVVNHCGLTVKMSWSRMTIRSAQVALRHELPIYRRVCRAETYRTKSTIHHTLRRNIALLEDGAKGEDDSASHDVFQKQLANDIQALLELFQEIIQDEYHPNTKILDHVITDFNHNVYDTEGYPTFSCDFCGSDIFVSFFCCNDCTLSGDKPSTVSDGLHICPGCYAEGRSCSCGRLMKPVQCWPLQILYSDHNRAVRALRSVGVDIFAEVGDYSRVLHNNATGVFEAGTAIQKWRTERLAKGVAQCYAKKTRPHALPDAVILQCLKCHKGRCFVHLAEGGVHSSEAITFYKMSRDHSPWHNLHLARRRTCASDKEAILAAEVSGDGFANLIGQKLAIMALLYPHCQPLNVSHIKLGWYDRVKSGEVSMAVLGPSNAMDMSFPRDGDDWGSPLTDICPEDSVSNTLVGQESPPRNTDPVRPGLSVSTKVQSSPAGMSESMKRKRNSVVFDGVAPPERKRKTNAGLAESSPSATHLSRPATSMKSDEKVRFEGPQSLQSTASLEGSLVQAISRIEALATVIAEQNMKIGLLVQDNIHLRDDIRNLSQTLQSSKRDLQRVEYMIPKITGELKGKFEKLLEKSEGRIQGPIDRLLEEFGRMRAANPPAPAHMPEIATFPSNTPFVPEPTTGDSECQWAPRDDYIPADLNKQHYQENYEQHGPPHNKYGRGGFRPYRGRGRGTRGGYFNRPHVQRPYFPNIPEGYGIVRVTATATPPTPTAPLLEPATTQMRTTPAPVPVGGGGGGGGGGATPRHGDMYHSQGHAPPPPQQQHPHTPSQHSHTYPQHPIPSPAPSTYARPHPPSHSHAHSHGDRNRSPSPSPAPSSSQQQQQQQQQRRWHVPRPQVYERAARASPLPHPRERIVEFHRDRHDERHHITPPGRSEADDDGYHDARYANTTYAPCSPAPSEEQLRWTPSDSGGQRHSQSRSQSPGSVMGRGYTGHGPSAHA